MLKLNIFCLIRAGFSIIVNLNYIKCVCGSCFGGGCFGDEIAV